VSLAARVTANSAVQLAARLATALIAFGITVLLLPRQLDEAGFGVYAFWATIFMLLGNVLDFGTGMVVVREVSRRRDQAGTLLGVLVGIKARFACAAVGLVWAAVLVFEGWTPRGMIVAVAAVHLLAHAATGALVIFHVDMRFSRVALAHVLGQSSWLAATLVLLAVGVREPAAYVAAFGLVPVVSGGLAWMWARRHVAIRFDADETTRRALWRQSWPMGVALTLATTYFWVDTVMLRPMLGEVAVAHYSAAYRLGMVAIMVPQVVNQVVFPLFSRAWTRGADALGELLAGTVSTLLTLGLAVAVVLPFVAADLMRLVYPPAYVAGAGCLAILAGAIVCVFVSYPHVDVLLAAGLPRLFMRLTAAGVVLNVALNLTLVPRLGIEGAAWATVATEALVLGAGAAMAARRVGVAVPPRALARPLAAGAAGAAGLALAPMETLPVWGRLAACAAVAAAILGAAGTLPPRLGGLAEGEGPA